MSQSERENKPPKRKQSTDHNNQSKQSNKRLKDPNKAPIPLKTTKEVIQDFQTSVEPLLGWRKADFQPTSIRISPSRNSKLAWAGRYVLFDALSSHVFPILSLSRHYFNTLEEVNIVFPIHPYKDLQFMGQLLDRLALLPHLISCTLGFHPKLHSEDYEGWGLTG